MGKNKKESSMTRAVNSVFTFVRFAEFEIFFVLFFIITFLLFKDLGAGGISNLFHHSFVQSKILADSMQQANNKGEEIESFGWWQKKKGEVERGFVCSKCSRTCWDVPIHA